MNSREKILAAVKKNQPAPEALPGLEGIAAIQYDNKEEKFRAVLQGIGGNIFTANSLEEVFTYTKTHFTEGNRFITSIEGAEGMMVLSGDEAALSMEDLEAAVIRAEFGVAENAAVWITHASVKIRVLPFICQHLVVVLNPKDIVNNMHEAYARIGDADNGFGVFIAGPSKTADIEQSLVLGAHGPKSMTVFLIDSL